MSVDIASMGISGGQSRFSGNRARLADGGMRAGVRYPSPFFDLGHTWLPQSVKKLLQWCRYYYLTNPLINAVIHKMSEYPITEIVIHERDPDLKDKWEKILGQHLRYRAFQIECGLDYFCYGMTVVTIHFPFTKWLICTKCKHKEKATRLKYKWRNLDYIIECKRCGETGPAKVQDYYEKDFRRIRLMRWNPENVFIDQGFAGAEPIYTFEVPSQLKFDINVGKKAVIDTIPDVYVEALRRGRNISFAQDNLFVLKRPIISSKENGWGMPLILPVLKDAFYLQVLRKAQEQIAQEHIVPLRILFPQAGSGTSDPYTSIPLDSWRNRIETEIAKWKYDSNYIPILPLPVGNQTIGGDGKALGLYQEIQVWSDQIVAGMGVPREFIFGGMQYSGSNVSMRMLENMFLGYRIDHENMLNDFVIRRIAHYMGWPAVRATMKKFKMADDLQRMGLQLQLNQAMKISDETLLQECDHDPVVEKERKERELTSQLAYQRKMQLSQAHTQGEMAVITAQYQAKAATFMPQPPDGGEPGASKAQEWGGGTPAGGGEAGADGGQQGEMIPGDQTGIPGVPSSVSVSPEEGQAAPSEGIPSEMQSPLSQQTQGGGYNLLYIARRMATQYEGLDDMAKQTELSTLQTSNPQLYSLVFRLLNDAKGSQADPLNPVQSPLPQQKPERRAAPVGM